MQLSSLNNICSRTNVVRSFTPFGNSGEGSRVSRVFALEKTLVAIERLLRGAMLAHPDDNAATYLPQIDRT